MAQTQIISNSKSPCIFWTSPKCDVAHTSLAQLRVTLMVKNELGALYRQPLPALNGRGEFAMHFCLTGQYTPQALSHILDNPTTNRQEAARKVIESAGGKLISFYGTPVEGPGALVRSEERRVGNGWRGVCARAQGRTREE